MWKAGRHSISLDAAINALERAATLPRRYFDAMTTASRYTAPAMALHRLLALIIVGAFSVGTYLADLPSSPQRLKRAGLCLPH